MGVLIEAVNVVIRNATVDERMAGGMPAYERQCPNATFCTDGEVCRVGFMTTQDAVAYVGELEKHGFRRPMESGSPEVAVITETAGFMYPCDWLELARVGVGNDKSAEVVWLRGTTLSRLVAPPKWTPGNIGRARVSDLQRDYEFLGTERNVDVFRDKATDRRVYVGRTQEGAPPAHVDSDVGDRFTSLLDELARLGAGEAKRRGDSRGEVRALYERAKRLVDETDGAEPGPLQIRGIAARLLARWDEAEMSFRRVTELRPEYLSGWLELTWALASLRRLEEAEAAARRAVDLAPDRADALGNLATVLLEAGRLEEAKDVADRAVAADSTDAKNRAVLVAIKRASARRNPWWRRLLGRTQST